MHVIITIYYSQDFYLVPECHIILQVTIKKMSKKKTFCTLQPLWALLWPAVTWQQFCKHSALCLMWGGHVWVLFDMSWVLFVAVSSDWIYSKSKITAVGFGGLRYFIFSNAHSFVSLRLWSSCIHRMWRLLGQTEAKGFDTSVVALNICTVRCETKPLTVV